MSSHLTRDQIRNFVITAHIDHGKSTLADRFLELTGTVEARKMQPQFLDRMGLERERGITIKMQPVRMTYHPNGLRGTTPNSTTVEPTQNNAENTSKVPRGSALGSFVMSAGVQRGSAQGSEFTLNLIDTPGHVDFSYEVSRALAAVEGAILLVDATKGVQAQTLANLELARAQGLTIIPAVNKIDLPQARVGEVRDEIAAVLGVPADEILAVSAKEGTGVPDLLNAIIARIPPPKGNPAAALRMLVFDSHYDDYRGVIAHVRVIGGTVRPRERIHFFASKVNAEASEVGIFRPDRTPKAELIAGEIGYIVTGLKDPSAVRIGDTIMESRISNLESLQPLPGYREPQPVVYASIFPEDADDLDALRDAISKLRLNDASLAAVPEESHALGRGFRCGFLGTLHLEIVVERLRREFGLRLIVTHPSVAFRVVLPDGSEKIVRTPRDFPAERRTVLEPWVRLEVLVPPEALASTIRVISETRGTVLKTESMTQARLKLLAEVPLLDVIEEFADTLKSATRGYASFSWTPIGERAGDLQKLTVLIAHEEVEAFARIVPRQLAESTARRLALQLKEALPPQLFAVAIQVAADGRIIARETISALRKDVTAPLYGGDFTRKKKLLVKQRKGKKRLEKMGRVRIPPETFLAVLRKG